MKPRWLILLTALLLAACSGTKPTPRPSATYDTVFKFTPVAQYLVDATLDTTHTEEIRLTIGAPEMWGDYSKDHKPSCKPPLDVAQDYVIPLFVSVTNISLADTTPANLNFVTMLAVDDADLSGQFGTGVDTAGGCSDVVPARNVTEQGPPGTHVNSVEVNDTRRYASGTQFNWAAAILVTGGGAKPLPATRLFLRLTPFGYPPGTLYHITRIAATDSVAGVITEGAEKGAFFVPLIPNTSPCTTIGRNVKMVCKTDLTPPE